MYPTLMSTDSLSAFVGVVTHIEADVMSSSSEYQTQSCVSYTLMQDVLVDQRSSSNTNGVAESATDWLVRLHNEDHPQNITQTLKTTRTINCTDSPCINFKMQKHDRLQP
jgi:hypothetical protein